MFETETMNTFAEWRAAFSECQTLEEPPVEPDQTEWMFARQDAMEEICREAGLRMRLDL
jgi:hypothetical protein